MTRIYTRRLCKGLMDAPKTIDDRVRYCMLPASDVQHLCRKCTKRFVPAKSSKGREVMAVSVNRDGVFRFAGYLCKKCTEFHTKTDCACEQCSKKRVQTTLDIDVPRDRKFKKGL